MEKALTKFKATKMNSKTWMTRTVTSRAASSMVRMRAAALKIKQIQSVPSSAIRSVPSSAPKSVTWDHPVF